MAVDRSSTRITWLAALLVALLAACLTGPAQAQPQPLRGLQLVDHRQQPLTARQLAGRPVLLHFVFTGCSATCPPQVQQLRAVHAALAPAVRGAVQFVSVTVDPVADTPAALAEFARRQQADRPGWRFVTGPPAQVLEVAERMQVFARPQPPAAPAAPAARTGPAPSAATLPRPDDHRSAVYLFAADGRLLQRFRGTPVDEARLVDEITRLSARPS